MQIKKIAVLAAVAATLAVAGCAKKEEAVEAPAAEEAAPVAEEAAPAAEASTPAEAEATVVEAAPALEPVAEAEATLATTEAMYIGEKALVDEIIGLRSNLATEVDDKDTIRSALPRCGPRCTWRRLRRASVRKLSG